MPSQKTVDWYIDNVEQWKNEIIFIRSIALASNLDESIKWGAPCYTYKGKNLLGLAAFQKYVCIWFHEGVFLADEQKKLQSGSDKTVKMRQWRFCNLEEIQEQAMLITTYIEESILHAEVGKKLPVVKKKPLQLPLEIQEKMKENTDFKRSFSNLSYSKQKEYGEYILEAKKIETKMSRLQKITPMILLGLGLYDKYK